MEIKEFVIDSQIPEVIKALAKLNKRAAKLGVTPITMSLTGATRTESVYVPFELQGLDLEGKRVKEIEVLFSEIVIVGESPILAGYEFLAQIDHDSAGYNVINNLSNENLSEAYGKADPVCDHCNIDRFRKSTYVVRYIETGMTKQVGSTCIKDFTGHKNPDAILDFYNQVHRIFGDFGSKSTEGYNIPREEWREETGYFVEMAAAVILKNGFVSKKRLEEMPGLETTCTTSELTLSFIYPPEGSYREEVIAEKRELLANPNVKVLVEAVEDYRKDLEAKDFRNDFEENVYNFLSGETFKHRYAGYVAAAVGSAHRAFCEKQENAPKSQKSNDHIGTLGQRGQFLLDLRYAKGYDSQFGYGVRYVFEDETGNSVIWFSSNDTKNLQPDMKYSLSAMVKSHGEYNGRNQTIINRPTQIEAV